MAYLKSLAGIGLTVMTVASVAIAADSPAPKRGDPNEKICEKIDTIGTRLGSKRVCATRAEWAERRRQEKETIDDAQRRVNGPCSTVNTHSGAPAC